MTIFDRFAPENPRHAGLDPASTVPRALSVLAAALTALILIVAAPALMRLMAAISAWTILAAALLAGPAFAQQADPRANDAMDIYTTFCASTVGSRDKAMAVLGSGNVFATRLPDTIVKQANGGRDGGVGWAIRSPRNAVLMLSYDPLGICSVRVADADEASMKAQFRELAVAAAAQAGKPLSEKPAEVRTQDGSKVTYQTYGFQTGDRTIAMIVSTSDRRVGAQQHFMTFGFVQPEK